MTVQGELVKPHLGPTLPGLLAWGEVVHRSFLRLHRAHNTTDANLLANRLYRNHRHPALHPPVLPLSAHSARPHIARSSMSSVVKLVPSRTAFFVCDIQERFRTAIHAYPSVIATAEKMVKGAALLNVPVVVTEQNPKALGATVPLPLGDLASGLHPEWSPLAKTKFSMVLPEVEKSLREWKTESVVLFGIESHVCVLQTALDLLERNIAVHILADGVSSCNHDEVGVALARLRASGAQITTSESVLFQLMVDASHPNFRAVSALIKASKEETKEALQSLVTGSVKL